MNTNWPRIDELSNSTLAQPTDLGCRNGWEDTPPEYIKCFNARIQGVVGALQHNVDLVHVKPPGNRSGLHTIFCPTCNITWTFDTSD